MSPPQEAAQVEPSPAASSFEAALQAARARKKAKGAENTYTNEEKEKVCAELIAKMQAAFELDRQAIKVGSGSS